MPSSTTAARTSSYVSSSLYHRSSGYGGGGGLSCASSHHLRSTSLDRSLDSGRPPISSSSSSGTSRYTPRTHHISGISSSTYQEFKERLARLEATTGSLPTPSSTASTVSSRVSALRNSGGVGGSSVTASSRIKGSDAIYERASPVLTGYRRFGDSSSSLYSGGSSGATQNSNSYLNGSSSSSAATSTTSATSTSLLGSDRNSSRLKRDSDCGSTISSSSSSSGGSSSSSPSLRSNSSSSKIDLLDENSNSTTKLSSTTTTSRTRSRAGSNKSDDGRGSHSPSSTSSKASTSSRYSSTSGYSSDTSSSSSPGTPHSSRCRSEKGLVGLRNLGNTCFMNSVLQCLSHSRPLLEYYLKESYLTDINTTTSAMKGALIKAFASLMQSLWETQPDELAVNPQAFKNQIQKFAPRFMGYRQQDSQEFLRYLLQGLHEDVNRVTSKPTSITTDIDESLSDNQKAVESWRRYIRYDDSKIVDLFVGQLKSTLSCTVCGYSSVTFDPFWDLSLPIPKSSGTVKLQQCLDLFTKEEILDGDEKPTCSKCKTRRKCTKSFSIQKFPKILVIHLKRFSPSERYRAKLSTPVEFPLQSLDLSSYATSHSKSQSCMYGLYGISNHSGSVYTGHYTAYCKHPYTGDWHDFNDSRVSKTSSSTIVSPEGYVLFYEQTVQSSRL